MVVALSIVISLNQAGKKLMIGSKTLNIKFSCLENLLSC